MKEELLNIFSRGEYKQIKQERDHYKENYESLRDQYKSVSICIDIEEKDLSTLREIITQFYKDYGKEKEENLYYSVVEDVLEKEFDEKIELPLLCSKDKFIEIIDIWQSHINNNSVIFLNYGSIQYIITCIDVIRHYSEGDNFNFNLTKSELEILDKIISSINKHNSLLNKNSNLVRVHKDRLPVIL